MSMLEHGLEMALEGATKHRRDADGTDHRQAHAMAVALIMLLNRNWPPADAADVMESAARLLVVRKQSVPSADDLARLRTMCNRLEDTYRNGAAATNDHDHERRTVFGQLPP